MKYKNFADFYFMAKIWKPFRDLCFYVTIECLKSVHEILKKLKISSLG